jgi:hypothetical protein
VPDDKRPPDADVDQVNSSLNEGIETCRSVVANYRNLLGGDATEQGTIEPKQPSNDI